MIRNFSLKLKNKHLAYRKRKVHEYVASLSEEKPVIILGVQKSGTTAIAALLAKACNEKATLDITRSIPHPEWKILVRYGIGSFDEYVYNYKSEFSSNIIKEPGLTFFYEDLAKIFPLAKYVMVIRNPADNIRSVLDRLQVPGHLESLDVSAYPELNKSPAWRINLDTSWMGYPPRNYVDALAYRWKLGADIYVKNKHNFTLVKYENFLDDKIGSIEKVAEKVGLHIEKDISHDIDKQFQHKGNSSVNLSEFFGNNYPLIKNMCFKTAEFFGYKL